jgi:DNA-binding FadR family transcriptional regulator
MVAPAPTRTRAEVAAETISEIARASVPGARLGSRAELRELCGVSVGTLHEALRLLQSTGEIVVRTGPGGGIFAGESSALGDLVRSVRAQGLTVPSYAETARVLAALSPLVFEDAVAAIDVDGAALLRQRFEALQKASRAELRDVVQASLEVFATIASIPPAGILRTIAGSILRVQLDTLRSISGPIDPEWRADVEAHVAAAAVLVDAIVARDAQAALAARGRPEFMRLFESIARVDGHGGPSLS